MTLTLNSDILAACTLTPKFPPSSIKAILIPTSVTPSPSMKNIR
jgi:hypothetical protein